MPVFDNGVVTINPLCCSLLRSCQVSVLSNAMSQRCKCNAKRLDFCPWGLI